MTDKEIIIDGVDVYKCGNAKRSIFGIDMECRLGCDCSQRPNCYFKQLKRKEQECEKLNKQVNDLLNKPEIQDKILWKIDNKALLESKDAWIYKLEQTLTEIKEIAEKEVKHAPDGETFTRPEIKQILQKISECEVEND